MTKVVLPCFAYFAHSLTHTHHHLRHPPSRVCSTLNQSRAHVKLIHLDPWDDPAGCLVCVQGLPSVQCVHVIPRLSPKALGVLHSFAWQRERAAAQALWPFPTITYNHYYHSTASWCGSVLGRCVLLVGSLTRCVSIWLLTPPLICETSLGGRTPLLTVADPIDGRQGDSMLGLGPGGPVSGQHCFIPCAMTPHCSSCSSCSSHLCDDHLG